MELRFYTQGEVRAEVVNGAKVISGRVVKYGAVSPKIGGAFHERVMRGAFDESLRAVQAGSKDIYSTWNHDINMPLGRTSVRSGKGSLQLSCDATGLNYRCELNDTSYANDLHENVRSGVVRGFSWGMEVPRDGQQWEDGECDDENCDDDRCTTRSITRMNLIEASPVLRPAYDPDGTLGNTGILARCDAQTLVELRSRFPHIAIPTLLTVEQDARNIIKAHMLSQEVEKDAAEQRRRDAVTREHQIFS
jgi:HK97 family phage prohead protease